MALPKHAMPAHLRAQENFAQDLVVDSSRIRGELGYAEAVAADDGITRAIAWERAHPPERIKPEWLEFAAEDAALAARAG